MAEDMLTDKQLSDISKDIGSNWEFLAIDLNIGQPAIDKIKEDIMGSTKQILKMLQNWRTAEKFNATLTTLLGKIRDNSLVVCDWRALSETFGSVVDNVLQKKTGHIPGPSAAVPQGRLVECVKDEKLLPHIFISYQWDIKANVELLKQHLNSAGYACWMDIRQMGGGDILYEKIDSGIRAAKVVICCMTEKFAKSKDCNKEVNLAVRLGKPIIPLMMTNMSSWPPEGAMGPIFGGMLYIKFAQEPGDLNADQIYWPELKFRELLTQLKSYVAPDESLVTPEYSRWWIAQE